MIIAFVKCVFVITAELFDFARDTFEVGVVFLKGVKFSINFLKLCIVFFDSLCLKIDLVFKLFPLFGGLVSFFSNDVNVTLSEFILLLNKIVVGILERMRKSLQNADLLEPLSSFQTYESRIWPESDEGYIAMLYSLSEDQTKELKNIL